ncbi:MAG: hypothetical protein FWF99_00035 [Desulfovibrionaceae bacterium]|nr:hypothetical protein [Desulfovibrionaceae bacterium]
MSESALGNTVILPVSSYPDENGIADLMFDANTLTKMNAVYLLDGIVPQAPDWADGDGAVIWTNGFNIAVRPFLGVVDGTVFTQEQLLLTVDNPDPLPRLDSVIMRRDYRARRGDVMILKGTPAANPVVPPLQYNRMGVADFEFARILVRNGIVMLAQGDIADMRKRLVANFGIRPTPDDYGKLFRIDARGELSLGFAVYPGDIDFKPWRNTELPFGWYYCNNDRYGLATKQGQVLNGLSANYKADWEITISGTAPNQTINVPNMFYTDGRGYFLRAGVTPGVIETDAMQQLTGGINNLTSRAGVATSGVFTTTSSSTSALYSSSSGTYTHHHVYFAASYQARTSTENRSLNKRMTPAIFLGV